MVEQRIEAQISSDIRTTTIGDIDFSVAPLSFEANEVTIVPGQRLRSLTVAENAADTIIDLLPVFQNTTGAPLVYTVENQFPTLVNARIEGTNLILDYQEGQFGTSEITVLATASDTGEFEDSDFLLTVTDDPATTTFNLDVDGSGAVSFARDGLLISAFLFFNRPDQTDFSGLDRFIVDPAATLKTGNDIANNIKSNLSALDADGSGAISFARDGLLISAFLFFNRPDQTDFSVIDRFITDPDASRETGNDVATYLRTLLPPAASGLGSDINDLTPAASTIGTIDNDVLTGDTGNNILLGGAGDDLLTGGAGKDTFQFGIDSGSDTVADFSVGEDLIAIESALGFSNSGELLAAITANGIVGDRFSSALDLGANGKIEILSDRALTVDNLAVI
jgi:Ca2+-binding RTX toxin-like protein